MPLSFKIIGVGLIVTLVGFYLAQKEARLRIWGKQTEATLVNAWDSSSHRSSSVAIQYEFMEEGGKARSGVFHIKSAAEIPATNKVAVLYLPTSTISRLANQPDTFSFLLFIGGVALTAFGFWYLMKRESVVDAHRETQASLDRAHSKTLAGRAERIIGR